MLVIHRTARTNVKYKISLWSYRHFLFPIFLTSFICSFLAELSDAAQVSTAPQISYSRQTTLGTVEYSSVSELMNDANATEELLYNNCLQIGTQNNAYTCQKVTFTTQTDSPSTVYFNGIPSAIQLGGEIAVTSKSFNSPVHHQVGSAAHIQTILVNHTCNAPYSRSESGSSNSRVLECKYTEPQSCAVDGNPINIGTGDKFEEEIDFSTADGVLKTERYYQNQYLGWQVSSPYSLVVVPAGNTSLANNQYSSIKIRKRNSLDATNPNRLIDYTHIEPFAYVNLLPQTIVYFKTGRLQHRFVETENGFVGDGLINAKVRLTRVNPADSGGASWRLINTNGDTLYFLANGSLQRTQFVEGGSLNYTYNETKLIAKTDHFGRTLTYNYDNKSRLISIDLPSNQQIVYEYGTDILRPEFYLLKKVTWPNGESISYIYNEAAHITGTNTSTMLTGKLDSQLNRIGTYKYNYGKAVSTEGALGSFKRVMQHYGNYSSVVNGLNSQRIYYFNTTLPDGTRLVTSTNQPAGSGCAASTESATYYTNGLKKTETNFNGHKTQFAYDDTRALETVRVEGIPKSNNTDYLPANTTLVAGARKITTQWHSQHRKPVTKAEPTLITTFIYNGDADPFNGSQIASCAPASIPLLCHKVQQATTDMNGAAGLNASINSGVAMRQEFYTYNDRGQQLSYSRSATGTPDELREYYAVTTSDWTLGDLKQITNALGQVTQFTRYDRNGRLLEMLDTNGVQTTFTYDVRGRLTSQSVAGATTSHTYDLNGNRITSLLPNGVTLNYEYDAAKRLTAIVDALGNKVNYEYDVESNVRVESITNASNTTTYTKQYVYDALSRVQNTLNSNNQGSTYLYDAKGNLTGEVDAKTQTTSNTFDPLDRLTRTTDALAGKTDYSYDANGNLIQVKDPKGNSTLYNYNAFGDLVSQTSPDTGTTTFTYDAAGNRTASVDARNIAVNYAYDALNRLTRASYPSSPADDVTYNYDNNTNGNYGLGRLTSIVTSKVRLDFEYNYQGLITKKYTQVSNTASSTQYRYDTAGNLAGITYPSGREVNYVFDTLGRIAAITTKANATASAQTLLNNISYLPFGPAQTFSYGNGLTHNQSYDQDYRLTAIDLGGILNRSYGYDAVDNITSINNGLSTNKNQSFSYDALNRLISANGGYGNLGYSYDAVGNRLTASTNGSTDSYSYPATSNRLAAITRANGNRNFAYDAAGNPTQRTGDDNSTQAFSFDATNRMAAVSVNGAATASYTYNPLGQRVVKTLASGAKEIYHYDEAGQLIAVTDGTGASLREYVYWGSQQIALAVKGTSSTPTTSLLDESSVSFQGSHIIATNNANYAGTGFIDYVGEGQANWLFYAPSSTTYNIKLRYSLGNTANRPLALLVDGVQKSLINFTPTATWAIWNTLELSVTIPQGNHTISLKTTGKSGPNVDQMELNYTVAGTASSLYFVHNDHLNTPQVVTDSAQQVVWMGDYQPFGKLAQNQSNSIELYSRFPGQYLDGETGLYYNYFRDYDPSIGRYIESDPIGLEGGINTYAYVEGNPLKGIDPYGLEIVENPNGTKGWVPRECGFPIGLRWLCDEEVPIPDVPLPSDIPPLPPGARQCTWSATFEGCVACCTGAGKGGLTNVCIDKCYQEPKYEKLSCPQTFSFN